MARKACDVESSGMFWSVRHVPCLCCREVILSECFDRWSWFWELSDQWGLCLPACNCLIYAHGIENVLVSEACLFCLLLSRHDSFKECFDWWSWFFETFLTSEACVCLSLFDLCSWRRGCVLVSEACFMPFVVLKWFFQTIFSDWWSWLWECSDQWSLLCLLFFCLSNVYVYENVFGQWGLFFAFCCHEAILLKTDWWSRYKIVLASGAVDLSE